MTPKLTGKRTCSNLGIILESWGAVPEVWGLGDREGGPASLSSSPGHSMPCHLPMLSACHRMPLSIFTAIFGYFPGAPTTKGSLRTLPGASQSPVKGRWAATMLCRKHLPFSALGPSRDQAAAFPLPGTPCPALLGRGSLQCATLLPLSETLCYSRTVRMRKSGQFYFRCDIWAVLRCVGEIRAQSRPCTSPPDSGRRIFPAVSSTCLCSCP